MWNWEVWVGSWEGMGGGYPPSFSYLLKNRVNAGSQTIVNTSMFDYPSLRYGLGIKNFFR